MRRSEGGRSRSCIDDNQRASQLYRFVLPFHRHSFASLHIASHDPAAINLVTAFLLSPSLCTLPAPILSIHTLASSAALHRLQAAPTTPNQSPCLQSPILNLILDTRYASRNCSRASFQSLLASSTDNGRDTSSMRMITILSFLSSILSSCLNCIRSRVKVSCRSYVLSSSAVFLYNPPCRPPSFMIFIPTAAH